MRTYLIAAIALTLNLGSVSAGAGSCTIGTDWWGVQSAKILFWNSLDDRYRARLDQYSKFRTYYFAGISTVFCI